MTIIGYDHMQVAIPSGGEDAARAFYGDELAMTEIRKPPALAGRGGCWFVAGSAVLHVGVEDPFTPARKAHPAFLVTDLGALYTKLNGHHRVCVRSDNEIPGVRRFHTTDPFGNRIEFQQG